MTSMKLVVLLLPFYLDLFQNIDSKKNRANFYDQVFPYTIDEKVTQFNEFFTYKNLIYEQIDDDTLELGGYIEFVKSLDPVLPLKMDLRTQYLERAIWNEGVIRLTERNFCPELLNPVKFWYNVTKMWNECPPQKGTKWNIESQVPNLLLDLPSNMPRTLWRWHFVLTQGVAGYEKIKFGFSLQLELLPV